MNGSNGSTGASGPPEGTLNGLAGDLVAERALGLELASWVELIPAADLVRAAREVGVLPAGGGETLAERSAVVEATRASLVRRVDAITARVMCLKPREECCVMREGKVCGA